MSTKNRIEKTKFPTHSPSTIKWFVPNDEERWSTKNNGNRRKW